MKPECVWNIFLNAVELNFKLGVTTACKKYTRRRFALGFCLPNFNIVKQNWKS